MKRRKKFVLAILSCIILILGNGTLAIAESIDKVSGDRILTVSEMKQDVDEVVAKIKLKHPLGKAGLNKEQLDIINKVYEDIKKPMSLDYFVIELRMLTTMLHDGHSWACVPRKYSGNHNEYLDIPIKILENNDIIITRDAYSFKKGDKLISMGGMKTDELIKKFSEIVENDNIFDLRNAMKVELNNKANLSYLGLVKNDKVDIDIERNGEVINIKKGFGSGLYIYSDNSGKLKVDWKVEKENNLGYFYINKCISNKDEGYEEYCKAVREFFLDVKKNNIQNIALDLRENGGGAPFVVNEILKYTNIESYIGYEGEEVIIEKSNDVNYLGKIMIMTGYRTFSAATWISTSMKDNDLATIVGEPGGMKPNFYYNSARTHFQVPNSKCEINITGTQGKAPKYKDHSDDITLNPDLLVYTTRQDILLGRDAQLEKVREIARGSLGYIVNEAWEEKREVAPVTKDGYLKVKLDTTHINKLEESVYVLNSNGDEVQVTARIDEDGIKIKPISVYESGQYSLYISKNAGICKGIKVIFNVK